MKTLVLALPENFTPAIAVVQHFSSSAGESLADFFAGFSVLPISEAMDKQPILSGNVYFAPPGYHLMSSKEHRFHLSVDEPVHYCRPSIDVFFETVAQSFGPRSTGIILSGANEDGAVGLKTIRDWGGRVWIQTPESAEFPMMPLEALKKVPEPDFMGDQNEIAQLLAGA